MPTRTAWATTPRAAAVLDLQRRFGVDTAQALRVRELALHLHQTLTPRELREHRLELAWTADLHEIGQQVSHHDHHRHSHYLISHMDLAGFSQSQLRRMGVLALGQRGGLRKLEAELREDALLWQVLALRLALLCCHGRETPERPPLKLKRREREVTLALDPAWVRAHPQTEYLLQPGIAAVEQERPAPASVGLIALEQGLLRAGTDGGNPLVAAV